MKNSRWMWVLAFVAAIIPAATLIYELLVNDLTAALLATTLVVVLSVTVVIAWRSGGSRAGSATPVPPPPDRSAKTPRGRNSAKPTQR